MNENILEMIDEMTAVLCFLLAISLFILLNQSTIDLLEAFNPDKHPGHEITQGSYESESPFVSGGDLLLQLYDGLEYDICVEGRDIPRSIKLQSLDPDLLKLEGRYLEEMVVDTSGRIVFINYQLNGNEGM